MLTKPHRYGSLSEARRSLASDGFHQTKTHVAAFAEVWTDSDGEIFAVVRRIPFGIGTFVQLGFHRH